MVVLELPRLQSGSRRASADKGTLFLRPDNSVERILAHRQRSLESQRSQRGESPVQPTGVAHGGEAGHLRSATFSGDVRMDNSGTAAHARERRPGRPEFQREQCVTTVHTEDNVRLVQHQKPANASASRAGCRSQRVGHRLPGGRRPAPATRRHVRSGPDRHPAGARHRRRHW